MIFNKFPNIFFGTFIKLSFNDLEKKKKSMGFFHKIALLHTFDWLTEWLTDWLIVWLTDW